MFKKTSRSARQDMWRECRQAGRGRDGTQQSIVRILYVLVLLREGGGGGGVLLCVARLFVRGSCDLAMGVGTST